MFVQKYVEGIPHRHHLTNGDPEKKKQFAQRSQTRRDELLSGYDDLYLPTRNHSRFVLPLSPVDPEYFPEKIPYRPWRTTSLTSFRMTTRPGVSDVGRGKKKRFHPKV